MPTLYGVWSLWQDLVSLSRSSIGTSPIRWSFWAESMPSSWEQRSQLSFMFLEFMTCPLLAKKLLRREDIDAVVTIGCVIQGETAHDEIVVSHAARKLMDLSLEFDKPVTLGITGPKMSRPGCP